MKHRKLTEEEYKYLWYIEYGEPYHHISPPPKIGEVIKTLLADGIVQQIANPTLEKSPLYTRFTRGKPNAYAFLAHEWMMFFRHPDEVYDYDDDMMGYDIEERVNDIIDALAFNLPE